MTTVRIIAWGGLDTLIVTAGVSALQPLMAVAGVETEGPDSTLGQASAEGIQYTVDVATKATAGNYFGPLIAAVTFVRSQRKKNNSLFDSTDIPADTPPVKYLPITFNPSSQHRCIRHSSTNPLSLRLHQNGFPPSLPITLHRTPLNSF